MASFNYHGCSRIHFSSIFQRMSRFSYHFSPRPKIELVLYCSYLFSSIPHWSGADLGRNKASFQPKKTFTSHVSKRGHSFGTTYVKN